MENFITIAKGIMLKDLPHDGIYVDYTMGDGYETLYMAKFVSEGNIVAFAKVDDDIDSAYMLFENNFQDNAHIVVDSPLNVEKYVAEQINGFTLDANKVAMDDDTIIETIKLSLKLLARNKRGMVVLGANNRASEEFLSSLSRDRVAVLKMAVANYESPTIYILEKTL